MSLRFTELAQVVQPLSERLVGAHVQKAWSPLPRLAYLELRVRMAEGFTKVLLVLSGEPGLERIAVASQRLSPGGDPGGG